MVHVLAIIVSCLLILAVLQDGFESVILPRRVSRRFRFSRQFYRTGAGKPPSFMRGMRAPFLLGTPGTGRGGIRWVIPRQIRIKRTPDDFGHGQLFLIASFFQLPLLSLCNIDVNPFFGHFSFSFLICTDIMMYNSIIS
jgi:hypothetical protein